MADGLEIRDEVNGGKRVVCAGNHTVKTEGEMERRRFGMVAEGYKIEEENVTESNQRKEDSREADRAQTMRDAAVVLSSAQNTEAYCESKRIEPPYRLVDRQLLTKLGGAPSFSIRLPRSVM